MHWQWISQLNLSLSLAMTYVPLFATIVTTILSLVLARATLRYAETTERTLALAREEFEREWSPELHIKLEKTSATDACVVVTNLAKISVLMQMVQFRKTAMGVPSLRWYLNEPLVGGTTWREEVGKRLLNATGEDFQGSVAVSITFYASGRMFRTDWFRFHVEVRSRRIERVEPENMAAARVKVLVPRNGAVKRGQELAMDVVGTTSEGN
jgi:cell division protein FtsL